MLMLILTQATDEKSEENRKELNQLLQKVAAGDKEAFGQLYYRTRVAIYGLALSYVKSAHTAQDITHDAFVRIWEAAPQYRAQGTPMGWMLAITRNLSLMRLRTQQRHTDLEEDQWDAIPAEAQAVTAEDRALLQDALSALEEGERRIVLLHAVAGLKHREIGSLLEIPLATVLSKYHRALKKLRIQLEGGGPR